MVVTIRDVARRAGVGQATASRVLTGSGPASAGARERVLAAAHELGYSVNRVARSLRTSRTDTIGLLISDVRNPFFGELAHAIDHAAAQHGIAVITTSTDERADRQASALEALVRQQVDGLLVVPQGGAPLAGVPSGLPLVLIDRRVEAAGAPVVQSDNAGGARTMVDHLVDVGHRDIAVISGPQSTSTGRERQQAIVGRLRERGCPPRPEWVLEGDFQLASGRAAASRLMSRAHRPTAVFAGDNLMTVGALIEARERGVKIGRDMALVSFDDTDWFPVVDPPVTAVVQDVPSLGASALSALQALVAGETTPDVVVPTSLVVRGSCALPRPTSAARSAS